MRDPQALRSQADGILELHEQGELDAALDACGALLAAADEADATDEVVRESLFTARFERAVLLTELGELEEAARAYAEAATTPTDLDDPDQRHELAMALLNEGICFDALGRTEEALRVYERLVVELGGADDPVTRDQVVRARVNRGAAQLELGRLPEALTVAEGLCGELDPADALEAEQLVMALRLRAQALEGLDRGREAADVLAEVERCSDEEPGVADQIAAALRERARLLDELGDREKAVALLDRAAELRERVGG